MSFYLKNLATIRAKDPDLAERIEASPYDPRVRVERENGRVTGIDRILDDGSTVAFRQEAVAPNIRKITERKLFSFSEVVILLGVGLGDTMVETLNASEPTTFVLLIEPSLPHFKKLIDAFDLSHHIADPRLSISIGENPVDAVMSRLESEFGVFTRPNFQVIKHGPSVSCDPDYFMKIDRILEKQKAMAQSNLDTISSLSGMWHRNIFANFPHILENPGIIHLFDKMKGIPALIVAAGPSLNKNCRWLKQAKESMVLICVDTAVKTLVRNGIEPHFVVSLDALFENYTHLAGVPNDDYTLIVNPVTHPMILDEHRGGMMITSYIEPLVGWLEKFTGDLGLNITGGSVATAALDFAYRIGCSPIIFTGQDLAFTGGRAHASGTGKEEIAYAAPNFSASSADVQTFLLNREQKLQISGNLGHRLTSSTKMKTWKNWFEIRIERDNIDCLNATEGGAEIKGAKKVCLQETVNRYRSRPVDVAARIRRALPVKPPVDAALLKKKLDAVAARAREIKKLCSLGLKEAAKIQTHAQRRTGKEDAQKAVTACVSYIQMVMKEQEFFTINHWRLEKTMDTIQRLQSGVKPSDEQKKMFINAESYLLFFREVYNVTKEFEKRVNAVKDLDDAAREKAHVR